MSDKGRPVQVTEKVKSGTTTAIRKIPGVFKVWGYRVQRCQKSGALHQKSTAFVELADGTVRGVDPENIKFTDKPTTRPSGGHENNQSLNVQ